jgi:hypothetical protein
LRSTDLKAQFISHLVLQLKVPKCEIFDRSDFHYFYTIKSVLEGDFRVKIKKFLQIFSGLFGAAKFVMRMLSLILRRIYFSLGKKFFIVKLLRPFVGVNSDI